MALPAEAEPALDKSVTSGFSRKAVEFPRLMLVNLPPAATMADVEAAPPLGSQDDVRQRIGAEIPGLQFDADGRGRLETAAHTIAIDLGRGDPVYTAVLDLRGDALATLTALLDRTGWRAFAPKRGTFVAPSDFA